MEQAQERADKEMADANAMQARYEAAWAGAEATHAQGRELLDSLTKVTLCHCEDLLGSAPLFSEGFRVNPELFPTKDLHAVCFLV